MSNPLWRRSQVLLPASTFHKTCHTNQSGKWMVQRCRHHLLHAVVTWLKGSSAVATWSQVVRSKHFYSIHEEAAVLGI